MQSDRRNALVAIAENDEFVRRALSRLVSSLGFQAEAFSSAQDLVGQLENDPSFKPACVIADFDMAGMSGLELLYYLKAQHPSVAVIIVTARGDDTIRDEALARGATAVVNKPMMGGDVLTLALHALLK